MIRQVIERQPTPPTLDAIYNDGTVDCIQEISSWIKRVDNLNLVVTESGKIVIYGMRGTTDVLDGHWLVRLDVSNYRVYNETDFLDRFKTV